MRTEPLIQYKALPGGTSHGDPRCPDRRGRDPADQGEISLAHGGVLFLDELPEFRKSVLEVLRQPSGRAKDSDIENSWKLRVPCWIYAGGGNESMPLRILPGYGESAPVRLRRFRSI